MSNAGTTLEDLERFLNEHNLRAPVRGYGARSGREGAESAPWPPRSGFSACHWRWDELHTALLQSAALVSVGPGGVTEMRTVSGELRTPAGTSAPRGPINLGTQILMPGERTRAHRNMKNETRLVWEAPPGAFFVCEYEAFPMERGDVIISPTWTYHDHWNAGDGPAIWFEGFDTGYAALAEGGVPLNDRFPDDTPYQEIKKPAEYGLKALGQVRSTSDVRGVSDQPPYPLPPVRYPWAETQAALAALREAEAPVDPCDGLYLTFTSPVDAGPTLPTIAWHVQLLAGRQKTLAHRHNSSTWYAAFEGEGVTVVQDERIEWHKGDIFMVPPWTWHSHENPTSGDAILFSIDDWPALTKLGFYKKEQAVL